jgi:hypothetical protein
MTVNLASNCHASPKTPKLIQKHNPTEEKEGCRHEGVRAFGDPNNLFMILQPEGGGVNLPVQVFHEPRIWTALELRA